MYAIPASGLIQYGYKQMGQIVASPLQGSPATATISLARPEFSFGVEVCDFEFGVAVSWFRDWPREYVPYMPT
jgi:hypothetical protein